QRAQPPNTANGKRRNYTSTDYTQRNTRRYAIPMFASFTLRAVRLFASFGGCALWRLRSLAVCAFQLLGNGFLVVGVYYAQVEHSPPARTFMPRAADRD